MSNYIEIQLTHFENPSLFFFRYLNENQAVQQLRQLENGIRQCVATRRDQRPHVPTVNSIVAYFHQKWQKWIRAQVLSISPNGVFQIFFVDYGYYHEDSDLHRFLELPPILTARSPVLQCGSLALKAAETIMDRSTQEMVIKPMRYWDAKAIVLVQHFNRTRGSTKFFFLPMGTKANGNHFGDIMVTRRGESYSVSAKLVEECLAVRRDGSSSSSSSSLSIKQDEKNKLTSNGSDSSSSSLNSSAPVFRPAAQVKREETKKQINNSSSSLSTSKISVPAKTPAKENREPINIVQVAASISQSAPSKTEIKQSETKKSNQPLMLPAGINLSEYTNKRKEVPKPPRKSLPQAPSSSGPKNGNATSRMRSPIHEETFATPPSDIMVHGERLVHPVESIDSSPFAKSIIISESYRKLLSHSWPQIEHGRSMVIVGGSKKDTRLAYLPVILNVLKANKSREETTAMGPIAIIVTKSSNDVKELARQIGADVDVVQAFGMNASKVDLMNGCDVLITTPPAFQRLNEGTSVKFFDKDRIKHVIFDGVDEMIEKFHLQINSIVRASTNGKLKVEKNPQIIVTSSAWMKEIEVKFMPLMEPRNMVICIDDFIEAAAFVGCKFAMESTSKVEEKSTKIVEIFRDESLKNVRTVVVTNDDKTAQDLIKRLEAAHVNIAASDDEWQQQIRGSFSILVTCDAKLEKMKLRDVQHLIHFAVPKSWKTFTSRFATLLNQMHLYMKMKSSKTAPSTKILLDDENVLEFATLINFLQSRKLAKIPEAVLESVKQINQQQELTKCEQDVKMCNNIWQFGECKKRRCALRHLFTDSDKPLPYLPTNSFVQFELVAVNSPASFVIKITSHFVNNKWLSWEEENEKIEKFLEKDLQAFCNSSEKRKPANVRVGESYVVLSDGKWKRCRVVEKLPLRDTYTVYLIDVGKEIPCVIAKLLQLPKNAAHLRPLVYNLQAANIIPIDGEEFWEKELKKVFTEMIQKATNEFANICTCQVQMAIRDIIFTKTFEAKDESGKIKLRLKNQLENMNMCEIDEDAGEKLRKLASIAGPEPPQEIVSHVNDSAVEDEYKILNELTEEKLAEIAQESWKHLSWGSAYEAHMKHFKNPESFLMVLESTDKKILQNFMAELQNCATKTPLESFNVGAVCAVAKDQKIQRGKILKVNDDDAIEVLLVDAGEVLECQKTHLFKLPVEMLTKMSFQSIHCRMVGIRPKFNMKTWPPKQRDSIHELIKSYKSPLKIYVMQRSEKNDELTQMGMASYDIILIDTKSSSHLDEIIVEKRYADRDVVKKPDNLEEMVDSGNISEAVEDESDIEVLKKLLENGLNENYGDDEEALNDGNEVELDDAAVEEQPPEPQFELPEVPSGLQYIHKHPRIEWWQNDVMVYLLIAAPDCEDYGLKVENSSMEITVKYKNSYERAVVNFYASVDSKMTSHELRGLNIVVRLVKRIFHNEWPRLTEAREKSPFIKFNAENISSDVEEKKSAKLSAMPRKKSLDTARDSEEVKDIEGLNLSEDEDFAENYF